jgi:hypothetical protein
VPESLDEFAARLKDDVEAGRITLGEAERRLAERAFGAPAQPVPATAAPDDPRIPAVVERLGELQGGDGWKTAPDYDSVALAAMDSIWSINAKYVGVENVIARYQAARAGQGADGSHDTPDDLLHFIAGQGSPEAFADAVKNRQRTSTRSGILKAEAVKLAAEVLRKHGIMTPADLRELDAKALAALEADWRAITGQGSGISFEYLLMLCGIEGVKVDRHIRRFVAESLSVPEGQVTVADARALVTAAADRLGITWRVADYAIWDEMSSR